MRILDKTVPTANKARKFLEILLQSSAAFLHGDVCDRLVYVCDSLQLHEVADYWRKVLKMNEYQKTRFSDNIVNTMVNVSI